MSIEKYITHFNNYLEGEFIKCFPESIHEQINYFISGGKRIRPVLFLIFAGIDGNQDNHDNQDNHNDESNEPNNHNKIKVINDLACVIEFLHCLSLIIDDMPNMDNDHIRRDKPTFHIKYGVQYTQFFIYYILTKLNIIINKTLNINLESQNPSDLDFKSGKDLYELFKYYINYLIDGQFIDLEYNQSISTNPANLSHLEINLNTTNSYLVYDIVSLILEEYNTSPHIINMKNIKKNIALNLRKTSSLFTLSILAGYICQNWKKDINYDINLSFLGKSDHHTINGSQVSLGDILEGITDEKTYDKLITILILWANLLGYLFQITDDILDMEQDSHNKTPNFAIDCINADNPTRRVISQHIVNKIRKWLDDNIIIINRKIQGGKMENMQKSQNSPICHFDIETLLAITNKIASREK